MKIYTQWILWSYILLPTICIFLSPALILGIAKAQQQRAKLMANAINARAKAAAALARNQARTYQKRLVPNNRFSNGIGHNYFKSRTPRDADIPMVTSDVGGEAFSRPTHWDQQEESMGQLQNMWNMNNFGNTPNTGFLRDAHMEENREKNQIVGSPRIYAKKHDSGAFFGRNVYDDIVAARNPTIEENEPTVPFAKSANPQPTLSKLKKKKKKQIEYNPSSFYYPPNYPSFYYTPYYARSDEGPQLGLIEQQEIIDQASREVMPLFQKAANPEPHSKKKKKGKKLAPCNYCPQSYYPGSYYGRSTEVFEFEPIQEPELISEHPTELSQRKSGHIQHTKVKKNKGNTDYSFYSSSYHGRNNENHDMVGAGNAHIPQEMVSDEPNLEVENILAVDMEVNNPEEATTSTDIHHDHSEDVGCELDDQLDKKPNSGNNYPTFDPYAYYEKTVNELSELSKKIAMAGKTIIPTPNADKKPDTPEVVPQVSYITSEENHNDGVYSGNENIDDVGLVNAESMGPSTAFEGKSASPDPDPHLHSHSYSHSHTHTHSHQKTFGKAKTFHSTPVVAPTVYGTSSPVVYPQSSGFSSKAEAHAKAETYNRGNIAHSYSNANSKSISHGYAPVSGIGELNRDLHTDSVSGLNQGFNTGYGQSNIQANAQANSAAGHSQDYSSGFGHTVPVNTGGFGQSGGIQSYGGGRYERPGAQNIGEQNINSGSFGQSGSQATSQSFASGGHLVPPAHTNAQATSQNFNSGGVQQSFSQASSQATSQIPATGGFLQPPIATAASQKFNSGRTQATSQSFASGGHLIPPANTNAQASSQNFNSGGVQQYFSQASSQATSHIPATGGFLQPPIATAASQNFNSGGTQNSFSQATSQSSSTTHRGQQFFQVLTPSSFVNTRSDTAVVGNPREDEGFVMPHLQDIPVSDLLDVMETEVNRFPRSQDLNDNIREKLNLATGIVHSHLEKHPRMPHKEQILEDDITRAGMKENNNHKAQLLTSEHFDRDKYENNGTVLQDITEDLVNKNLREKRDIANNSLHTETELNQNDTNWKLSTVNDNTLGQQGPDSLLQTSDETEEEMGNDDAKDNNQHDQKETIGSVLQENTDATSSVNRNVLGATIIAKVDSVEMPNGSPDTTTEMAEVSNNFDHEMVERMNPDDLATTEIIGITTLIIDKNPNEQDVVNPGHLLVTNENAKILVNAIMNTTQDPNSETSLGAIKGQEGPVQEPNGHHPATENNEHQLSFIETSNHEPAVGSMTQIMRDSQNTVVAPTEFTTTQNLETSNDVTVVPTTVEATSEHSPTRVLSEVSSETILGMSRNPEHEQLNNNVASEKKKELEADGIVKDDSHSNEDSSEENKNNSTTDKINTTQPNENFANLTLEEIEDIQFRIPDNSTVFPENITISKAVANNESRNPLDSQGENKVVDSRRNFSFPFRGIDSKIVFNPSGAPFDSIEAEMSVLTDEEKEAFIQQEMKLISEVIEETLKNDQSWGKGLKEHNKTQGSETETSKDDTVSSPNLFHDFRRSNNDEYQRSTRSASPFQQDFDIILGAHKEKIENIQKEATDDDDLLMISFIGDSVIKDLENRRNQVEENMNIDKGVKVRENSSVSRVERSVPVTRLINDPTIKVDVPKTLDNVESVVWHTFENSRAPMYHVRKMLGNGKNVVMSAAKIPPNNVLIPSQYEIAKVSGSNNDKRLGAINQKMLSARGNFGDANEQSELAADDSFGIKDTFQKIGGVVRESVKSGKDVVAHANDAATDVRNVLYTAKNAAPRLIVPGQVPVIASRSSGFDVSPLARKAMVITPKLLDVQENEVGAEENQDQQFVGMGNILDAVGLTKPNPPEVEMEKIILEPPTPSGIMTQRNLPKELRSSSAIKPWTTDNLKNNKYLGSIGTLGAEQNNFRSISEPEQSTGTKSLKEFLTKMHQEMKEILTSQHEERKKKRKQMTRKPKTKSNNINVKKDLKLPKKKPTRKAASPDKSPVKKIDEILGVPKSQINTNIATEGNYPTLPPDILDIFADNNFYGAKQESSNLKTTNSRMNYVNTNIVENDNSPPPLERTISNSRDVRQYISSTDTKQNSPHNIYNSDNETVSLFLTPELLTPFMGQPSEDVLHNYMRENGDEVSSEERTSDSRKPLQGTTVYPINPLNKNISVPLSENREPLFSLTSLVPDSHVSERTVNSTNGGWSRMSSDSTRDFSRMNFLAKPDSTAAADTDTSHKTENKENLNELMDNLKGNEESTAHFQGDDVVAKGGNFGRDADQRHDLGHILGAINPIMFERYFNESLTFNHPNAQSTTHKPVLGNIHSTSPPIFENQGTDDNKLKENALDEDSVVNLDENKKQHISPKSEREQISEKVDVENSNATGRTSMKIINTYQKPFMGYISQKKIREFLNKYNNNLLDSSEEAEAEIPHQQRDINPVKNIIYTEDYDFDSYM